MYVAYGIPMSALRVTAADGCGCSGLGATAMTYAQYLAAVKARGDQIARIESVYASAMKSYEGQYARWSALNSAYKSAMQGYSMTVAQIKAKNMATAKAVAATYKLTLPAGFEGCVTQAEHNYYDSNCTVIKGLGGYRNFGDNCGAKNLPVCNYPTMPKSPGPKPPMPVKPPYPPPIAPVAPPKPVAPMAVVAKPAPRPVMTAQIAPAPAPAPPVMAPVMAPIVAPEPEPEPEPAPPPKQASMVKGGLIALVVVVGGIALYKTFSKPKAA